MTGQDSKSSQRSTAKGVDDVFAGVVKPDEPGFALIVRYRGGLSVQRAYGVRDLRTKTPIDAGTNFRLASVTKQFTAMAVMLLVHDGKLRYDQTISSI